MASKGVSPVHAIVVHDDGSFFVSRRVELLFPRGKVSLRFRAFAPDGKVRRPVRVVREWPSGKRAFGRELVAVEFDWAEPHAYALDDLRVELRRAIESDDDVYAQLRSQSAHLSALRTATTFDALVEAVDPP